MMVVVANGECEVMGCIVDLNNRCSTKLKVGEGEGEGCRSSCKGCGKEYCCSGTSANPSVCKPSVYSEIFKVACPRSYSYAFDDPSSTFTCDGPSDFYLSEMISQLIRAYDFVMLNVDFTLTTKASVNDRDSFSYFCHVEKSQGSE